MNICLSFSLLFKKKWKFSEEMKPIYLEIVMIAWQKAGNTSQMCFICDKTSRFKEE